MEVQWECVDWLDLLAHPLYLTQALGRQWRTTETFFSEVNAMVMAVPRESQTLTVSESPGSLLKNTYTLGPTQTYSILIYRLGSRHLYF